MQPAHRPFWMLLLVLCANARQPSPGSSGGRSLLLAACPAGCEKCVGQGTSAGKKCKTCYNSLVVLRSANAGVDGSCGCPAGTYLVGSGADMDCVSCSKGAYCPGGTLAASIQQSCPANMVTLDTGSKQVSACVNNPGYRYVPGTAKSAPSATLCPANSYNPGLKKQQTCRPCPSGFVTRPDDIAAVRTTLASCYAPPGYFVKGSGVVVACPKGEWKAGWNNAASCTRCITGVTTTSPAKTSAADCNTLRPGFQGVLAVAANGITSVSLCQRNAFCTGTTLSTESDSPQGATECSSGLWTQAPGAVSASQCLVPPGHFVGASGLKACPDGSYRSGWDLAATNPVCSSCGTSISSDVDAFPISFYAVDGSLIETIPARTSVESCYIEPGNGIYRMADGSFVARVCNGTTEFGVPDRQYGLFPAPCKQCPFNMVVGAMAASANAHAFAAGLAISPVACVTQAGYGYDDWGLLCKQGSYGPGGTRDPCIPCPVGKTTDGEGKSSIDDCVDEPGYNEDGVPCPIGSYAIGGGNCQDCDTGLSTAVEGSRSADDCNVCTPGFSPVVPGTCSQCAANLYSEGGMPSGPVALDCSPCPNTTFVLHGSSVPLTLAGVTAAGATSASECVVSLAWSELGPINVSAAALTTETNAMTAADCAAACAADQACQFVNIQYNTDGSMDCKLKLLTSEGPTAAGWTLFGLKQVQAGDVGALSKPAAQSVGSGQFTWWADPSILGETVALTGVTDQADLSASQCQDGCTQSYTCAAVVLVYSTGSPEPACKHVIPSAADDSAGSNTFTLLKAVLARTDPAGVIQTVAG